MPQHPTPEKKMANELGGTQDTQTQNERAKGVVRSQKTATQ